MAISLQVVVKRVDFLKSLAAATEAGQVRFLFKAGFAVRQRARRSLRAAPQMSKSDMSEKQLAEYERARAEFALGIRTEKPRRPERVAKPGQLPLLHTRPKSPLKAALTFAVDRAAVDVVVGPERTKSNLQRLEAEFPFMRPALDSVVPQFPQMLRAALGG